MSKSKVTSRRQFLKHSRAVVHHCKRLDVARSPSDSERPHSRRRARAGRSWKIPDQQSTETALASLTPTCNMHWRGYGRLPERRRSVTTCGRSPVR